MPEKILIIDDDMDTLRLVGLMLQRQGYQITAANNGTQGLEKAISDHPDLILLDVMMPDMDGYEVAQKLRQNSATAGIPILMFTAKSQLDDKVTGFEAGADDYLTKPTHPSELQAHVKALLARSVKSPAPTKATGPLSDRAFTIGVLSARGGLGVSTLAVNLGSSLQKYAEGDVIVAEMTPGIGTLGRDMGTFDLGGLVEILSTTTNEITRDKVESTLITHETNLKLLLASDKPSDIQLIDALPQYEMLFNRLTSLAQFLVLDFGAGLPRFSETLLSQCDHVIVIVEGLTNSVKHTRVLLDNILDLEIDKSQLSVVMSNRVRSEVLLSRDRVLENLGYPIAVSLTPAPELFTQAIRMHKPAVFYQKESLTAQQFAKLATIMTEHEAAKK